jgi:GNAT superfamily N-acetyltransferase
MSGRSKDDVQIKIRRGHWTHVYAEADDRDVSNLDYGPKRLRLGARGEVRMAGIAGVSTLPEFRQRGLARRVFTRAMEEIGRERYSCVGLFTSTRIVAHRLYRRHGFVDVVRQRSAHKILDPAGLVCEALSQMLKESPPMKGRRWILGVKLHLHAPMRLRVEDGRLSQLPTTDRQTDLSLALSAAALLALWQREISLRYAEAANLVRWQGSTALHDRVAEALAFWHSALD